MGRPNETPGVRLDKRLPVPVSDKMLDFVDQARGNKSRAAYVRDLIRRHAFEMNAHREAGK